LRLRFSSKRQRLAAITSVVAVAVLGVSGAAGLVASHNAHANAANYTYFDTHWYKIGRDDAIYDDNNNPDSLFAQQATADMAYPADHIAPAQMQASANAFQSIARANSGAGGAWQVVGPTTANESPYATYTGSPAQVSGRITALGIGSSCSTTQCTLYVGAAGGGVWRTDNALSSTPTWTPVSNGLYTNAIGSIWVDPNNTDHVLVGTGEPNGSSDSEAGLGLFQTTNGGGSWTLVPGSFAVSGGRAIGSIAVDPANPNHIFIGTDDARHGSASVIGGRFTPPNAPQLGLYESTNGGASFSLAFSKPSDTVNPSSPNGSDFNRGGVQEVAFDPTTPGRIYISVSDYGLYRTASGGGYEQVYASPYQGNPALSSVGRIQFALAPLSNGKLRIYLGDAGLGTAQLYRIDDASVPASTLTDGTNNPGWLSLSSKTNGTPGYASYNFCETQCWYDMFVASPAGSPDNVWLGGSFAYGEQFGRSNGRAVQRSTDAGVDFTDMTNDLQFNGMHPDQHALVFDPQNPDIAFVGSDGGLVRTSGQFASQVNDPYVGCTGAYRAKLSTASMTDCQHWLSAVPTQITFMNAGLNTLQFQSVAVDAHNVNNLVGGTQDNGTLFRQGTSTTWNQTVGGDGGQSGINAANPSISFHSYYGAAHDVNFNNGDPASWDWIADPLGNNESASFYVPIIYDPNPATASSIFEGEQHIFRTMDNGGQQAYLDQHCNEFTGDFQARCGDWQPLGGVYADPTDPYPSTTPNDAGDLSGTYFGTDKGGSAPSSNFVVAISRAPSNTGTLWAATRLGRVFISTNADAANPASVSFTRIDNSNTPTRFVSGIAVDPNDPNHAFISYSGYDAYSTQAGTATGHVFEVRYNPQTGTATWKNLSNGLGDLPITGIAFDSHANEIFLATDYGVLYTVGGGSPHWLPVGTGLPTVAVYGLTLAHTSTGSVLYAATHGRGIYSLQLNF
jgi:hypothetical protein